MLARFIAKLFWKGPKMPERAKILGLPKNEVLKPVLLIERERKSIKEVVAWAIDKGFDGEIKYDNILHTKLQ